MKFYISESVQNILRQDEKFLKKFWKNVDKKSEDECWNWTGKLNKGYGRFFMLKSMGHIEHHGLLI